MTDITTMNENVFWLLAVNSNSAKHEQTTASSFTSSLWIGNQQPHKRRGCAREEDRQKKKKRLIGQFFFFFFFVGAELLNSDLPAGQREEG